MSLVGRIHEGFGAERGLGMHHADCGGILGHDDPRNDVALQVVDLAMQRALISEVGESPARPKVFDACQSRSENILHCNRFGQRSRRTDNHNAPPVLIPEQFPALGGVSIESASLANQFVAASRQVRDHAGAMA